MELMRISKDTSRLHSTLGKNLYSSKYSWISEICQNAVDSHRMAGVKEPVRIGIRCDEVDRNRQFFYVKDIGLSFKDRDDFIAKVCTILDSGKEQEKVKDENCAMGKYGIGTISVSAYQKEWKYTVVCPSGMKLEAKLMDTPKGIGFEVNERGICEEEVGVLFEVEIHLLGTAALIEAMREKLCYFKDILFEFPEDLLKDHRELLTMNTDFQIFQSDDFQISTLSYNTFMHISLDQYTYQINWDVLGIDAPIEINIGLRFTLADGLESNSTREELQYTDEYKEIILDKIKKVATWFVNRFNDNAPDEYTSITGMKNAIDEPIVEIATEEYCIIDLIPYSSVPLKESKFKGVSRDIFNKFMRKTGNGVHLFQREFCVSLSGNILKNSHITGIYGKRPILLDNNLTSSLSKYLSEHYRGSYIHREVKVPLESRNIHLTIQYIYDLDRYLMKKTYKETGVNIWRPIIEQHQILRNFLIKDNFLSASEFILPPTPKRTISKNRIQRVKLDLKTLSGEINIEYAGPMEIFRTDYICKFSSKIVKLKDLHKIPIFHIYGLASDRKRLELIYRLFYKAHKDESITPLNINVCIIGVSQWKYIQKLQLHNFMHIDTFLEGRNKIFRGIMTSYIIEKELREPYQRTFNVIGLFNRYLSKRIGQQLYDLQQYVLRYSFSHTTYVTSTEMKPLVDRMHEIKAYDLMIWEKFQDMRKRIDNFDYVHLLSSHTDCYDKDRIRRGIKMMRDISRSRKIRMDNKHYKKTK